MSMRIGQIGQIASWLQRRTRKMGDQPPAPHPGGGGLPRPRGRSFSGLGSYNGQHLMGVAEKERIEVEAEAEAGQGCFLERNRPGRRHGLLSPHVLVANGYAGGIDATSTPPMMTTMYACADGRLRKGPATMRSNQRGGEMPRVHAVVFGGCHVSHVLYQDEPPAIVERRLWLAVSIFATRFMAPSIRKRRYNKLTARQQTSVH